MRTLSQSELAAGADVPAEWPDGDVLGWIVNVAARPSGEATATPDGTGESARRDGAG